MYVFWLLIEFLVGACLLHLQVVIKENCILAIKVEKIEIVAVQLNIVPLNQPMFCVGGTGLPFSI